VFTITITFSGDVRVSTESDGAIAVVNAAISGSDKSVARVSVNLNGTAPSSGIYTVTVSYTEAGATKTFVRNFATGPNNVIYETTSFFIHGILGLNLAAAELSVALDFATDDFDYRIDFINETISFGQEVLYAFGKTQTVVEGGKARFFPTFSKTIDISRFIPRKAGVSFWVRVRFTDANGVVTGATTLEIKNRPIEPSLKGAARTLYAVPEGSMVGVFTNTLPVALDIRFLHDRGQGVILPAGGTGTAATTFEYPIDMFPFGAGASARTVAVNKGDWVLNTAGELEESEGVFSSLPVRFKIAAQPRAPRLDKMVITAGKKGAPDFINTLNDRMVVLATVTDATSGDESRDFVAIPAKNVTVLAFSNLNPIMREVMVGANAAANPPEPGTLHYEFEIRFAAGKRPMSAAAFLQLPAAEYDRIVNANSPAGRAAAFTTVHATALALVVADVVEANGTIINAALTAFETLSDEVKALLVTEKAHLDALIAAHDALSAD
jgi:hypothetical protein